MNTDPPVPPSRTRQCEKSDNTRVSVRTATPFALVAAVILALSPTDAQSPALTVGGEVETPLSLSLEDLRTMGRQRAQVDVQGRRATYEGVPLSEILRRAGIIIGRAPLRGKALTSVVVVSAPDGFQAVFALAELDPVSTDNRVIVADTRDGSPLSDDEGLCESWRPATSIRPAGSATRFC